MELSFYRPAAEQFTCSRSTGLHFSAGGIDRCFGISDEFGPSEGEFGLTIRLSKRLQSCRLSSDLLYIIHQSSNYSKSIETRRNAYDSIAQSLSSVGGFLFSSKSSDSARHAATQLMLVLISILSVIDSSVARSIQSVLLLGLEDYTTDQRGDVGSWVRLSCISGLRSLVNVFSSLGNDLLLEEWLPIAALIEIVGGLIKQMVERIDNVREEAGKNLLETCKAVEKVDLWRSLEGLDLLKELFPE